MGQGNKIRRLIQEAERMQSLAGIITENFKSVSDEGFDETLVKYISQPFLEQRYKNLDDNGKLLLVNRVRSILNGSPSNMKFDSYSKTSFSLMVADVVACMAVNSDSETERRNAYNFLMIFYNPYPDSAGQSLTGKFAPVVPVVLPSDFDFESYRHDELMDVLSESFFKTLEYLIKRGKYDPNKGQAFSYILLKIAWKNRAVNELQSFANKKSRYEIPQDKLPDTEFDPGPDDNDGAVLDNDQKIELIASRLSASEKRILYAWYDWYKKNASSEGSMIKDMVKNNEKVNQYLTAMLPDIKESSIRTYLTRLRVKISEMIKDKGLMGRLGLDKFSAKRIDVSDILSGTQKITESSLRELVAGFIRENHEKYSNPKKY